MIELLSLTALRSFTDVARAITCGSSARKRWVSNTIMFTNAKRRVKFAPNRWNTALRAVYKVTLNTFSESCGWIFSLTLPTVLWVLLLIPSITTSECCTVTQIGTFGAGSKEIAAPMSVKTSCQYLQCKTGLNSTGGLPLNIQAGVSSLTRALGHWPGCCVTVLLLFV